MVGASMTLRGDDYDRLAAARVKRIDNPNLNRQTPGSMTLLRPAQARPGLQSASALRSWDRTTGRRPDLDCAWCSSIPRSHMRISCVGGGRPAMGDLPLSMAS